MSEFKEFLEIYNIYRDHIKHEDTLLNQRLNFLITSQSFLFIIYFALFKDIATHLGTNCILLCSICFLGYFMNILTESSIQGFVDASSAINQQWKTEYLKKSKIVETKRYDSKTKRNIQIEKEDLEHSTNLAFLTLNTKDLITTIPNIRYENDDKHINTQIQKYRDQMPVWFLRIWGVLFVAPLIFLLMQTYCQN